MIRFSNAMTMFGIQQMQNAFGVVTDSQSVINRFVNALDSISNSLSSQIDDSKRSTMDSMTRTSSDIVDRTFDAMNVQALDPRGMMDTTADLMRKTTDSMADMMRRTTSSMSSGAQSGSNSGEPEPAADVLAGRKK